MGELMDCLKSFGLQDDDTLIRTGTEFLLSSQNPDGSWGDMKTTDMYLRYHPTWTAVDGLRDYKWKRR
jgi:squalene cyclase